ncbi:MAG: glutaminyl-peptide cyclotransferase [Candidatus Kapabacteria bacterium]|nr:glutaminyl-peptide cyclotransferase [Candidatus Kapabacteria bacterium]
MNIQLGTFISTLALIILLCIGTSCGKGNKPDVPNNQDKPATSSPLEKRDLEQAPAKYYTYKIINKYKHDSKSYTQGLIFQDGYFLESAGLRGKSSLRKVELVTGKILKKVDVNPDYFAEGIALFNKKIYQLTWISGKCIVYDAETFAELEQFNYDGEGWGLTNDSKLLIMSDGTNSISYRNPNDFKIDHTIYVFDGSKPVYFLNELEYINGEIWANVYQTEKIARIDPETGRVKAWIDCSGIKYYLKSSLLSDVLNGIAYNPINKKYYITGKNWDTLFEIELTEK